MRTNALRFKEVILKVARQDSVNVGVAKARFAGEANYSVPSLERLMRGEAVSEDHRRGTLKAVRARGLKFKEADLFIAGETATGESA
jgi:hypothetical protein